MTLSFGHENFSLGSPKVKFILKIDPLQVIKYRFLELITLPSLMKVVQEVNPVCWQVLVKISFCLGKFNLTGFLMLRLTTA